MSEEIQFDSVTLKHAGKEWWTLRQCGKCAALVLVESAQAHADWHAAMRAEVGMASLGFGGMGL